MSLETLETTRLMLKYRDEDFFVHWLKYGALSSLLFKKCFWMFGLPYHFWKKPD